MMKFEGTGKTIMVSYLITEGAGLQVKGVLDQDSKKTFHLSATKKRLISGAEQLKIKKLDKNNELKEVTEDNWKEFEEHNADSNGQVFYSAEKQRIILHELNNIRAEEEQKIPGYPDISIYNGQAISK